MKFDRKIATAIFIDNDGNVVFQDRQGHSKDREKFGLWGGGLAKNENPEEGLRRELVEELNYKPRKLYFWKEDVVSGITADGYIYNLRVYLFISDITPELLNSKVNEGNGLVRMKLKEVNPTDFGSGANKLFLELNELFDTGKISEILAQVQGDSSVI